MAGGKPFFSKTVEAHIQSECADGFDHARIDLDRKAAERILHLAAIVRKESVSSVHDYDYTPSFLATDYDSEDESLKEVEVSTDCDQIVVTRDDFWWEGYLKHSDPPVSWSTDRITLEELRVALMPMKELPKHINREWHDKDSGIRLKRRLAGR